MLHTALMALIAILVILIGLLTILFIFLFCLTVVIAPLEKRYLRDLLPLPDENQECAAPRFDPGPHPYMDAVNELAG